jgi:hypothetical protein
MPITPGDAYQHPQTQTQYRPPSGAFPELTKIAKDCGNDDQVTLQEP